jgi:WD40 repeat protein
MQPKKIKLLRRLVGVAGAATLAPLIGLAALAQQPAKPDSLEKGSPAGTAILQDTQTAARPGPSIRELIKALKDPDPAVRRKAATALSESDFTDEEIRDVRVALFSAAHNDKDASVRNAASGAADLLGRARNRRQLDALRQKMKRSDFSKEQAAPDPKPVKVTMTLADSQGRPVPDADIAMFVHHSDGEPTIWYILERPSLSRSRVRSGTDGRAEFTPDMTMVGRGDIALYMLQQQERLAGILRVARADLSKPQKLTLEPACRVRLGVSDDELRAVAAGFQIAPERLSSGKNAYVNLGEYGKDPSPLWAGTTGTHLEFLLPPGIYHLQVYSRDTAEVIRDVEIKPGRRELFLGTIQLPPSVPAKNGNFPFDRESRILQGRVILLGDTRGTQDIAVSPDGKLLASTHWYNADPSEVKLWDLETGEQLAVLAASRSSLSAVAISPDGKTLAAAYGDGVIILWDVATQTPRATLKAHDKGILTVAFSPDSRMLASGGSGREVRLTELASGRQLGSIPGLHGNVRAVRFSPDGTLLAVAAGESVTLWTVLDWKIQSDLAGAGFMPLGLAFSPDGKTLAAAGGETKQLVRKNTDGDEPKGPPALQALTRVWDVQTGRERTVFSHPKQDRRPPGLDWNFDSSVAFSPDGKTLAVVSMRDLYLWNAETGELRDWSTTMIGGSADKVVFSPDGKLLVRLNAARVIVSRMTLR